MISTPTPDARRSGALLAACIAVLLLSSAATASQPGTVVVDVRDGAISLEATQAAWADVIVELTRKTGITIHVVSLPAEPLTASFSQVDAAQAVRRLFGGSAGFAFVYGPGPVPVDVWVVPPAAAVEPRTQANAADRLADAPGDRTIDALARVVVTDPDVDVRSAAATALVQIGTPRAFQAARAAIFDEAKLVRLRTVEALADHGGEPATQILREALRDSTEEVRDAAAAGIPSPEIANATPSTVAGRQQ